MSITGLFLIGGSLLWIGISLIRHNRSRKPTVDDQVRLHLDYVRRREILMAQERIEILRNQREATRLAIQAKMEEIKKSGPVRTHIPVDSVNQELNEQIVLDAIARENRAKAALLGVLRRDGVPQAHIDHIMEMIDQPEKHKDENDGIILPDNSS